MSDFDRLCKEVESLNPVQYTDVLRAKSAKVMIALSAITKDGLSGAEIFIGFVLGAVMADRKFDESEFSLIRPTLEAAVGREVTYEEVKVIFREAKKDAKDNEVILAAMVGAIGELSEELKEDIIIITLLICAVDGKISFNEKRYIKKLMES
ncbi:MAG: TerB family tellurite resistance protein [Thermoplasmata archaeon]|nr:TerB family tellurite resistance protein [Thermoplasmata archaeon]